MHLDVQLEVFYTKEYCSTAYWLSNRDFESNLNVERCFQLERIRSNRVFYYSHATPWVASDCSSTMNVLHIVLTVMAANFQLVSKWVSPLLYVFLDWKLEHWGIIFIRSMPCSRETGRNQESICENYSKSCVVPAGLKCGEISIMNFDTREPCATPLWNFGNLIGLRGRRMNKTDAQAWVVCKMLCINLLKPLAAPA